MNKIDREKDVGTPSKLNLEQEKHMKNKTKLILNKLKIFSYDSIYKTKMVLKKKMDA